MPGGADLFMEKDAMISDCGKYRYLLRRAWDHTLPRGLFVMLNPSTADAEVDDATIRSCIRLCRSWSFGSFEVVNLFGWRATDPKDLPPSMETAVGPDNFKIMDAAIGRCDVPIAAWGKSDKHPMVYNYGSMVVSSLRGQRPAVFCLGKNGDGSPKHPLFIKSGTPLVVY